MEYRSIDKIFLFDMFLFTEACKGHSEYGYGRLEIYPSIFCSIFEKLLRTQDLSLGECFFVSLNLHLSSRLSGVR